MVLHLPPALSYRRAMCSCMIRSLPQSRENRQLSVDLPEPDADEAAHSRRLAALIREEIATSGPMPFARFMDRCLYAPGLGYYSAGRLKFGAAGDFVTAPELGVLFARCIARELAPVMRAIGNDAIFFELGGGSGAFAHDCLLELQALDALPRYYWLLEPSADLRERQRKYLCEVLSPELFARVEWLDRPPLLPWSGALFANEVLDALPVTRFAINDGHAFEEHVAVDAYGAFECIYRPADPLVSGAVRHLERKLGAPFANGYRSEALPQLPWWIEAIAGTLRRGAALFVDYGYPRREFYLAERRDGTLMCHYRHRAHADPLMLPGLQDITAFVDFTALAEAGLCAGFELVAYVSQARFLLAAGLDAAFTTTYATAKDEAARYALSLEVKRLTLPGEMGERFQAMLFARGLDSQALFASMLEIDRSERL